MAGLVGSFSFLAIYLAATISLVYADQNPPAIFVFGDSLSDVGNNNVDENFYRANYPHYGVDFPGGMATGRFTNGYNFIDIIARQMGFNLSPPAYVSVNKTGDLLQGVNFASGGSGILVDCMDGTTKKCFTMDEQIGYFKLVRRLLRLAIGKKATSELISRSLFIFTCGGNDLNNFFTKYFLNPFAPIDDYVANMTSTFGYQLKALYDLEARKFAIINVPAIGMIPTARALENLKIVGIDVKKILNGYAQKFNEREYIMLTKLRATLPGMTFSVGNAYVAIMDVINDPEKFGMKNVTSPCCGAAKFVPWPPFVEVSYCSPSSSLCRNHSDHVFWDYIHPTLPVIEYSSALYYSGNMTYAKPVNIKQLVTDESLRGDAGGAGPGGAEAMDVTRAYAR